MNRRENETDARIVIDELLAQSGWDADDQSMVGTEVQAASAPNRAGIVDRAGAKPFETHAPVYGLVAAAGKFSPDQTVGTEHDEIGWMAVPGRVRLTRDHFVARIEGHSMEPAIPDGSYCLFRTDRGGTREGKLVLVWHRGCTDPALGGEFSVKKYSSTKEAEPDGDSWSHREIRLQPLNPDPAYEDLVFDPGAEGDLRVIGEFVCQLEAADDESSTGRADYVLYDQRGRPLAVIEAKRNAINPYVAKQQALPYAKALEAPFIFLTNGELTYFWDYQNDDARPIAGFFSQRDLERMVEARETRRPLATVEIPEHYIRQGETRTVRPYQADAMHMQAVVKTPHIEINIKGEIPDKLMSVLEEEYGEQVQLLEEEDVNVNIFETDWYRNIKSGMTPGDNLRIYRENHGLTQAKLGEMLGGVPRQHISNMEREMRSISLKTARKLAKLFQVSPEKFI